MKNKQKWDNGNCVILTQLYDYIGRVFEYEDYKHIQEMLNKEMKDKLNSSMNSSM